MLDRLYPIYFWLLVVPLVALATVIGALIAIPLSLLVSPRLANLQVAVRWSRIIATLLPIRVTVEGLEQIDRSRSYVVVANHQSQFDIPVIYGYCGLDLRWVMKAELGKVPFIAQGCRAIGHIFINRQDPDQARSAINEAVARLPQGTGILFFPEGTRSRDGRLLPFKKGAFRVALDQQLPILPMTVSGTRHINTSKTLKVRPGPAHLKIHQPIETAGLPVTEERTLRRRVRAVINSGLPADEQEVETEARSLHAT